jgi:hypothetical protein
MKTRTVILWVAVSMVVWMICAIGLLLPVLAPGF